MTLLTTAPASGTEMGFFADLLVILASAALVAVVLQRLRLAVIPAYLIAGGLVGPHALGLTRSLEGLVGTSHLALILLLFGIGLQLHLAVIRYNFWQLVLAGVGSCLLTVLIGWPLAALFGLAPPAALAVAMALSMSSTAAVLRIFVERRELRRPHGRLALAVLVVQDLLVLAMMAALPAIETWAGLRSAELAAGSPPSSWIEIVAKGLLRLAAVAALMLAGRLLLPKILRESLRTHSLEVLLVTGVTIAIGAALAAHTLGFSYELGAFLAGFLLAGTPFRHQLTGQIGPVRDLLVALFFVTVGMKLDPQVLAANWWIIILGSVLLIVTKTVIIGGVCWLTGATGRIATAVGFSLAQAGEFSLILLDASSTRGLVSQTTSAATIAIVVISLILTPPLINLGDYMAERARRLGAPTWLRPRHRPPEPLREERSDAAEARRAVIGGFGPVGRLILERLEEAGVHCTIVELNALTVLSNARAGRRMIFGDISNRDVMESANVPLADALILTIPDDEAAARACTLARRLNPALFIAARAGSEKARKVMLASGANHVTVDELAAANVMADEVMSTCCRPPQEAPAETEGAPPTSAATASETASAPAESVT
ncbi:MAG: cation:proton antiporter [Planctomycetota bacterium]